MDTQKLLCILEGENNIDSSAEVYYCTQEGKVYGELQVSRRKVFFVPADCPENAFYIQKPSPKKSFASSSQSVKNSELVSAELKRFEVCIDIGDIISCQLK